MLVLLALALMLPYSLGYKLESGCAKWSLKAESISDVCCEVCQPGNRLVTQCGPDHKVLCEPCPNGTYVDESNSMICSRCSECTDPQRVKTACTAARDTACECVQGFLCGDSSCSFCIKECGRGEEPTEFRDCRSCPEGTFNDQPNSRCVGWSKNCPQPDQQIVATGTAFHDIVCSRAPDPEPITPSPAPPHAALGIVHAVAVSCICLIICVLLLVACVWMRGEIVKTPPGLEESAAGQKLVPEPEHCSFCFPQEESGSSSAASLVSDSDDKPFELVV